MPKLFKWSSIPFETVPNLFPVTMDNAFTFSFFSLCLNYVRFRDTILRVNFFSSLESTDIGFRIPLGKACWSEKIYLFVEYSIAQNETTYVRDLFSRRGENSSLTILNSRESNWNWNFKQPIKSQGGTITLLFQLVTWQTLRYMYTYKTNQRDQRAKV